LLVLLRFHLFLIYIPLPFFYPLSPFSLISSVASSLCFGIKDDDGNKFFLGRVSSLQTEHGFVVVDGRGDQMFFHKNGIETNIWNSLRTGSRITFNIGFTFSGPIAINIKLESIDNISQS
ncbi:MAG: cold shock domain-containing protein, partial [Pseudanabaena sp. M114S2SP2A07QC]|nr:cold shock domain-containing protein [Pseudanabaena sp. M114S2SP2A07QC]